MCSKLGCYLLKVDCRKYRLLDVSLRVTTKQKPIADTQKIMRKDSKNSTKESNQTTRERARDEETEELQNSQKPVNKMGISTYLPIITLNLNGLNFPTKRQSG